ncbi:MAG TPA: DcrB-related protein [Actinomycetota bacterium]|nr:DcrB-related protein [Actinomycetota bacterium]
MSRPLKGVVMDRSARSARMLAFAVASALLFAACGGDGAEEPTGAPPATETAAPTGEPTATTSPSADAGRYENAEYGFTIDHPSTWVVDESPQGGAVVQLVAVTSAAASLPANINVVVEDLPFDLTARQYLDIGWEKLKPQLSDLEEIDTGELTVGDLPAASLEYRGRFEGMPGVGHFYQVAVLDGRRAFVFTYVGNDAAFETHRAEAEAIVDSFAVT